MKTRTKLTGFAICLGLVFVLSGCCPGPWPWCPPTEPEPFRFTPAAITRLCPTHIGGDREFDGHGPDVEAKADIQIRNAKIALKRIINPAKLSR